MKNTVEATEDRFAQSCSCVAATLFWFSLGIYSVASGTSGTEAPMLVQAWITKHRRLMITVIGSTALIACAAVGLRWLDAFARGTPDFAVVQNDLRRIQQGRAKPDRWGRVTFPHHTTYVTRDMAQKLTILWPYNLAHDDNYFEGFLFSDVMLTSTQVTAFAPVRGGYLNKPKSWMTHLTVDRTLGDHWYHVQGEMYK